MSAPTASVTKLLEQWREGDLAALDQLTRLVYAELKRLASRQLRGEVAGRTLTPTALVSEAFVRMVGAEPPRFEDRVHFFAAAARHMRHILVDSARTRMAAKRGGGARPVTLDEGTLASSGEDVVAIDEALSALAEVDARKARVVELHFFGGMSLKEVASSLEVHPNTITRDLRLAEAWLNRWLAEH